MNTFEGFNSPLQKEHFNENYIESNRFPEAQFIGRVIEQIDWAKPGNYPIRAKGDFMLHGLTKNLIIPSQIQVISEQEIRIKSQFKISLSEFGIKIPRMVHKKLAEMIDVSLDCRLIKTDS
jgi:polyisoprenoid-binding protein YceI